MARPRRMNLRLYVDGLIALGLVLLCLAGVALCIRDTLEAMRSASWPVIEART